MAPKKSFTVFSAFVFLFLPIVITLSQLSASASQGDMHTFAGLGRGYAGDGGVATAALLNSPGAAAVDASGNLYISDRANQRIRKVDAAGNISTVAGTGRPGYSGDGSAAVAARIKNPSGIAVDGSGDVLFADMGNNRIRMINPAGIITTVAGTGKPGYSGDGSAAALASINHAEGVAIDAKGNIYISDTGNNRVRIISPAGIITTIAGTGRPGYGGDGGPATSARLNRPAGVAVDSSGRIYIADCYNQRVRVIDTSGTITTLAGTGKAGYAGDEGPATSARLNFPSGVAVDASGNVYISDWHNQRVRMVDASGTINTLAGTGKAGFSGDGSAAGSAMLNYPFGVAVDASGDVFVADSKNNRVRMVEGPSYPLPVSTIASPASGVAAYSGGSGITVSGAASAKNGVSFVEVSTDGGSTWQTATGTTSWSYSWNPPQKGTYLIMSRATDSQGKIQTIVNCKIVKAIQKKGAALPVSNIESPKKGATITTSTFVITGTASDGNGPGVASVEVSTDGGATWEEASGTSKWSYSWTPPKNGSYTVMAMATDKSGKSETPTTGITVNVDISSSTNSLTAPASSTGNSYYISPSGSDSSGNGTITSPWLTWTHASSKLKPGDTLYARGGTYYNQGGWGSGGTANWYSASGTQTAPVTFKAYPGETPVFDGGAKATSNSSILSGYEWTGGVGVGLCFSNGISWVVVDGIVFQHYSFDAAIIAADWGGGGASNVVIQNCTIHDCGGANATSSGDNQDHAIYLGAGTANFTIKNNLIYNIAACGITGWHAPGASNVVMYNNVISACRFGICFGDGANGLDIYNNTIDRCNYGIDCGNAGDTDPVGVYNAVVENNILTDNTVCGLRVGSFDKTQVSSDYNLYYGNAADVIWTGTSYKLAGFQSLRPETSGNELHSVGANPSFVSPGSNYQLSSGSPAIDKGTTISAVPYDKNYENRPQGPAYDIGAYEYPN